jgi:hypothetical protein
MTLKYNITAQDYLVFRLCPLSSILKNTTPPKANPGVLLTVGGNI